MESMTIKDFAKEYYSIKAKNIADFSKWWLFEKEVENTLNYATAGGVTVGSLLLAGEANKSISPELMTAFQNLMGDKADSIEEIRRILTTQLWNGDASVFGFINKLKGQVGEDSFIDMAQQAGFNARLAESGSQEAWDVAIDHTDGWTQYFQVKTYSNPEGVIEHIRTVMNKLDSNSIFDGSNIVNSIDFAVPSNIIDDVSTLANQANLNVNLVPLNITANEAGAIVQDGFNAVAESGIADFFETLAIGSLTSATLHTLARAFLMYKGAKDSQHFMAGVLEETAYTTGGLGAGMLAGKAISNFTILGGMPTFAIVFATSMVTRGMLKRIASRSSYKEWLSQQNDYLKSKVQTAFA